MKSLIVSSINKTKYKACGLVETKKMEVYHSDIPIGITEYHSPETVLDVKWYHSDRNELIQQTFFCYHEASYILAQSIGTSHFFFRK